MLTHKERTALLEVADEAAKHQHFRRYSYDALDVSMECERLKRIAKVTGWDEAIKAAAVEMVRLRMEILGLRPEVY